MNFARVRFAILSAVTLLVVPTSARAQITTYTSLAAYLAAVTAPGTDTYSGFSVIDVTPSPIVRTAGLYSYRATAVSLPGEVGDVGFFGAGTATNPALSTNNADDTIVLDQFAPTVRGIGGFFYGTELFGGFLGGTSITLNVLTANGLSQQVVLSNTTPTGFFGFVSASSAFTSLSVRVTPPNTESAFPTIDNLVLGGTPAPITAVPEPSTYALLGAGLAMIAGCARRQRA